VFFVRTVPRLYNEDLRQLRDKIEGVSWNGSWQMMVQSSSGVPSEQLVESWAAQGNLRRWSHEFRCEVLTIVQWRDHGSWGICVKFVARKRLVKTAIEWGY
jgi:hypothetical protein